MLIDFYSEAQNSRGNGVWVSGSDLPTLHVIVSGLLRESDVSWLKNDGLVFAPHVSPSAAKSFPFYLPDFSKFPLVTGYFENSLYMQLISILSNIFMRKVITYNDSGVSRFNVTFPNNS